MVFDSKKSASIYDGYQSGVKLKKSNRDPITGEPGAHPVGTAVGSALGATAGVVSAAAWGAASGATLGPAGAMAGAVAGGILGGGIGHGMSEDINPTREDAYWRENYGACAYVPQGASYELYQPAYLYGVDAGLQHKGRDFNELEPELSEGWDHARGNSSLNWSEARFATRDAYHRLFTADSEISEDDVF